jgi:hypothetical protein
MCRENSQKRREITSMSSADDVIEMKSLANELADRLVGAGAKLAARAGAVIQAIGGGITENRALEFLSGRARRVDGWEKDNARRRLAALRNRERIERENEHLAWLECEIARHRASGEELRGPLVDGLEHVLRAARGEAGAVALQTDELQP